MCSDGLTNELGEAEIAQVMLERDDLEAAANELVRLALQRGGIDNVTVVVLEVVAGESSTVSDEVVLLPEARGGTPEPAVAGESGAITEAIALTPSPSEPVAPAPEPDPATAPLRSQGAVQTKISGTPPAGPPVAKATYSRPLVLVPQKKRRRRERGDRIFTIRVAVFVLLFVAVLGGASGVVVWFNNASFFVGLDRGYVAIFQGRPGGTLWFKPAVVERTTLKPSDLLASNAVYLRQGMEESSYQAARNLVRNLSLERSRLAAITSVTTTTVAPVTTTTSPSYPSSTVVTTTSVPATTTTRPPVVATTTTVVAPVTSANTKVVGGVTTTSVALSTPTISVPGTTTSTVPSAGTLTTTGAK